ncbi:MAG: bifunctional UDP-N-acetylglucosamine diphosphorylase/glucosamine-1-phosphate N-acetyltransferase GlmU [Myxococcales bacterium]|nr:bifunctional UDP-N-acetylglucosamine diphosphorylase/glucosamine-1-phosphate N-acetyltransferase GlmU [Myxococcales bacterium]MCB9524983.1 bifunctional UDP-N-acetylglucosamine diphosphorylase/glucosamine-1-phosphate N-acetyltransferase GlmU [Myxococcales bacterium]
MRAKAVVVMAAGKGTRMRSRQTKVLHSVAGRPLIHYPVAQALALGAERVVLVLGHQREAVEASVRAAFPDAPIEVAVQAEQLGTAHAVLCARDALSDFAGDVFILSGDVPTLRDETLQALDERAGDAPVAVLGMRLAEPAAYGRFVRQEGALAAIVEARDCSPSQLAIDEVNAGIYRVDAGFLFETLAAVGSDNAQGEFYLTDLVAAAAAQGVAVRDLVLEGDAALELHGVNDRQDLAAAEARIQARLRAHWLAAGVTMQSPDSVTLGHRVQLAPDVVLEPDVSLLGDTAIGEGAWIERGVRIQDSQVGAGSRILGHSYLESAQVGAGCQVGPFARLREGTVLCEGVKVGNFVETKKTELGKGAKASHLSYLGDALVGPGANIGAGTITCNYDGVNKHRTVIGAGAFIGSDTQLVAPVTVGDGAYVGAGSTITEPVPADGLALSRVRQRVIEGWAARQRARMSKKKEG